MLMCQSDLDMRSQWRSFGVCNVKQMNVEGWDHACLFYVGLGLTRTKGSLFSSRQASTSVSEAYPMCGYGMQAGLLRPPIWLLGRVVQKRQARFTLRSTRFQTLRLPLAKEAEPGTRPIQALPAAAQQNRQKQTEGIHRGPSEA